MIAIASRGDGVPKQPPPKSSRLTCLYCGNNPVPHFFTWYSETVDIIFQPLRRLVFFNALALMLGRWLKAGRFGWKAARLGLALGILKRQTSVADCKVRRAQVLWEEAGRRGINFCGLKLFGKNLDMYLAEKRGKTLFIDGLPRPGNYRPDALETLDDKSVLKTKLAAAGLPAPPGGGAFKMATAIKIFRSVNKPVIVKPRSGSRGRHTTTFVYSEADLRRAVKIARQLCAWVVVEEQLFGPVYRVTIIGGPSTALGTYRLAGVLRGDPPELTGDGTHSIAELIDIKNTLAHPGVKDVVVDDSMKLFLWRQNWQLSSVPAGGTIVNLSEKIGVNYGGSSSEDFDICHPDNKQLFLRAAEVLGDPVVGFDYIIGDIAKSYRQQRSGFIEANSLPFINLHHDPLKGAPRNAAALVWDMMGW